jgi:hypothetical protein
MIYTGMEQEALRTVTNVRNRYDGWKRNPFNEEECGNHYARAMASWATIIALSEFHYSSVEHSFSITSKPGNYFWSNGYSWGNVELRKEENKKTKVIISVHYGSLMIQTLEVKCAGILNLKNPLTLTEGAQQEFNF